MREMPATGEIQSHDTIIGTQQCGIDSKVGGTATVGLHIHTPLGRVHVEGLQRTLAAQRLDLCKASMKKYGWNKTKNDLSSKNSSVNATPSTNALLSTMYTIVVSYLVVVELQS